MQKTAHYPPRRRLAFSRTSKSMVYAFDRLSDKSRFQRNMNDADMLAKERAFHSESATYEADFIAYGMDPDFRKDLNDAANAFEASFSNTASATAYTQAATADTSAKIESWSAIAYWDSRLNEFKVVQLSD